MHCRSFACHHQVFSWQEMVLSELKDPEEVQVIFFVHFELLARVAGCLPVPQLEPAALYFMLDITSPRRQALQLSDSMLPLLCVTPIIGT